eukprot:766826-Prymnesium_polylepis.3
MECERAHMVVGTVVERNLNLYLPLAAWWCLTQQCSVVERHDGSWCSTDQAPWRCHAVSALETHAVDCDERAACRVAGSRANTNNSRRRVKAKKASVHTIDGGEGQLRRLSMARPALSKVASLCVPAAPPKLQVGASTEIRVSGTLDVITICVPPALGPQAGARCSVNWIVLRS